MGLSLPRRFLLSEPDARCIRIVSGAVSLSEGATRTWVTLTRTGSFTDPRYGRFEITPKMLADMVRNFDAGTFGQEIFLDVAHEPEKGAAAKVLELKSDGTRLRASVEWTPYGIAAVRERGFRYLSADFFDDYIDNEAGRSHGPLLRGAGLTIRPVIKRLDPVQLSEAFLSSGPVLIAPGLVRELTEHLEMTMNKWLTELQRRLAQKNLAEAQTKALCEAYTTAAKALGEDETGLEALVKQLSEAADALKQAPPGAPVQLSVTAGVSAEGVAEAVAKALAERDTAAKQLAERTGTLQTLFDDTLAGLAKGLSEATLKQLSHARDVIAPTMSEAKVKQLAESQAKLGEQLEAARQLSALGYGSMAGSPRVSVDESNGIKKLAEEIRIHLRNGGYDGLRLAADDKLSPFARRVLAEFDQVHGSALHHEAKQLSASREVSSGLRVLADGAVDTGNMNLPASYQREVLRESLQDLRILDLVGATVDPTHAATHSIPYETRDLSAVRNDGVVYEGQPIHRGGIVQDSELAYILPMKIALEQTNEAMWFSVHNSLINFDAWGRNIASNALAIRELLCRRIANEMQRVADGYSVAVVTNENLEPQSTGARSVYKTAQWPVVRPHQVRDLKGNAVGSVIHPVVVTYDGVARAEYDGSNQQAAGTYYRWVSRNIGYVQLVNQLGVAVNGVDGTTFTITYRYSTNVVKFDMDVPNGTRRERHLNGLLQAVGARKAQMSGERFVMPTFGLMSPVLHNAITDAENFEWGTSRPDVGITSAGTLTPVKAIPQWDTNAPGIDLGDERLILGRRGDFRYTVARPFSIGAPFEQQIDGRPTGKKIAYGEEYASLCVPTRLSEGYTSILAYSATARAAF